MKQSVQRRKIQEGNLKVDSVVSGNWNATDGEIKTKSHFDDENDDK